MHSQEQSPQKKSRAYSTVAPTVLPYRIPTQMMSDSKNLKTILVKSKYIDESKVSAVQNNFFKTKLHSDNDTDRTIQFRKSAKPKIQNKLHLDLPTQKKAQVHKYVGEQKHFEHTVSSFFARIFKSCLTPETEQNFKQCDYCEHRYSKDYEQHKKRQRQQFSRQMSQPYVSYRRLTQRQKQPIQVFYQEITNQPIRNNRWESTHLDSKKM